MFDDHGGGNPHGQRSYLGGELARRCCRRGQPGADAQPHQFDEAITERSDLSRILDIPRPTTMAMNSITEI